MANTVLLLPTDDRDVVSLTARAHDVEQHARGMVVASGDDLAKASEFLVGVAKSRQAAEARRKFFVGPLNAHVKAINDLFARIASPFQGAEAAVKDKIAAYRRVQQERVAAERRRLEAEERARWVAAEASRVASEQAARVAAMAAATPNEDDAERAAFEARLADVKAQQDATRARTELMTVETAPPPAKSVVTGAGRVTARRSWKFEVVNESEVPRAYFVVDERMVREAIKAGIREIPGIRIYESEDIAVTVRT